MRRKVKRKSTKLLIRKDEMILIKNSEIVKDVKLYGNLYQVIKDYEKLSEELFYSNKILDEKARAVILNNKNIFNERYKK